MTTVMFDPRKKKEEEIESGKPKTRSEWIAFILGLLTIPLFFMLLWNWLMPSIFGLASIGYLKSIGLLSLSFMIFRK